jgi:hypothetical protein
MLMRKLIPITLILVLVVSLCGCLSSGSSGEQDISVDDLMELAQDAAENIESCKIEASMTMDMSSGSESTSVSIDMTGAMDVTDEELELIMEMVLPSELMGMDFPEDASIEMYMVDGWMYMGMPGESGSMEWLKMEMPDVDDLPDQTGLSPDELDAALTEMLDWLESSTEMTMEGSEEVKGVDCYYLEVEVDPAELMEMMMGNMEDLGLEDLGINMDDMTGGFTDDIDDAVKSLNFKVWFAKGTNLPMKMEVNMELEIDEYGTNTEADFGLELVIFDYGETVEVDVPQEALDNAQDMSSYYGDYGYYDGYY